MSEKNYVVNVKTQAGTIFTVRADSASELKSNILDVIEQEANESVLALEELLTGRKPQPAQPTAQEVMGAVFGATPVETPAFAPVPPPSAPPQTNASATGSRMCSHGPMTARKGTGSKGEWKGLFCPTPKGTVGQCDPVWLNRSMPEWNSI